MELEEVKPSKTNPWKLRAVFRKETGCKQTNYQSAKT
jgi:hypothetical protein